jgi:hypothetical protein
MLSGHECRAKPFGRLTSDLLRVWALVFRISQVHFLLALLATFSLPAAVVITRPYEGITRLERTETTPRRLRMQIVQIDLAARGLRFKVTPPGGSLDTIRQTTLDFLTQEHAQLAINAHFFVPYPATNLEANLVGIAGSEGLVFSPFEPQPVGPGYTDQSYAILPFAPALNIAANNYASVVHHDPAFADGRHVLETVLETASLWNVVSGSAQIISNGLVAVPRYGLPDGLNTVNGYSDDKSWYAQLRARTAIGLTRGNQTLVLFTVDETGGSVGMSVEEVGQLLLRDYDVYNALNLDGGGSTTLALQDPLTHSDSVVNAPSGSPPGRAVGSNLAVFAQPSPGLSPWLTITVTETNAVVFSWPANSPGCRLEVNPALTTAGWQEVPRVSGQLNGAAHIVVSPQANPRFYRLISRP